MGLSDEFRSLHSAGIFAMANPWDRGSAVELERLGFAALATTSAGFGRAIGKDDYQITRDELVEHVGELTSVMTVPLNVDSEQLFPHDAGGIGETVRLLAGAGASGCSIEDFDPERGAIMASDEAVTAVALAAAACAKHGLVLTARCESHLYGKADLDDTIARLGAYREAGAEVVYAPGLTDPSDIRRVVAEIDAPCNVLAMPKGPTVSELGALGVRRVSSGSGMHNATRRALRDAATAFADGTIDGLSPE